MNSLFLSLLAAGCGALANLIFRKNADHSKSNNPNGYLVFYFLSSFLFSFLLFSEGLNTQINYTVLSIGALVGILTSTLMVLIGRALTRGPAALTFAFLSASAVFPGVLLFVSLGTDFGFSCSLLQFAGMALVLFGLFWGAIRQSGNQVSMNWLKYALGVFLVQVFALTLIQARCILFDIGEGSFLANFKITEKDDVWFMPGQFGVSLLILLTLFLKENKKLYARESVYGSLAGLANFASSLLLLLATKQALPFEKSMLFPCFAVAGIILNNIWATLLYKEKFNFGTNTFCSLGIIMGAL